MEVKGGGATACILAGFIFMPESKEGGAKACILIIPVITFEVKL